MSATVSTERDISRPPIWPVIIAPLVFLVYYLALRTAFAQSIESVLWKSTNEDALSGVVWGNHWIYRCIAEYFCVTLGAFVSGGIARGRARAGAVVGSLGASLLFTAQFAIYIYNWKFVGADLPSLDEPWYQTTIDALMIGAAPIIALFAAEHIDASHREAPGLGGINRWHAIWLWIATYFYGLAMITPIARFYGIQMTGNIIAILVAFIVNFVPAAVVGIPLYYGIGILRGDHGDTMPPAARNFVGALVLIGGLVAGFVVQLGWYWVFGKIREAVFGS